MTLRAFIHSEEHRYPVGLGVDGEPILGGVSERTTWAVVTAALMIGWAVAVALLFVAFTDWSSNTKVLVAAVISGPGAAVIL